MPRKKAKQKAGNRFAPEEMLEIYPALVGRAPRKKGVSRARLFVHGRLYCPAAPSAIRSRLARHIFQRAGGDLAAHSRTVFAERARAFLATSLHGRPLFCGNREDGTVLCRTGADGHFRADLEIAEGDLRQLRIGHSLTAEFLEIPYVSLLEPGFSVISDIDDTLKISNVHDKRVLLAHTFLHPYRPVPGMPDLLRRFERSGGAFHYLSASPWQLFRPLREFFHEYRYPSGSWHLKKFRLKDRSAVNLALSGYRAKRRSLSLLLELLKDRPIILIGDSTESDCLLYAEAQRAYPRQVVQILIRDTGFGRRLPRILAQLDRRERRRWQIFSDPGELNVDFLDSLPRPGTQSE